MTPDQRTARRALLVSVLILLVIFLVLWWDRSGAPEKGSFEGAYQWQDWPGAGPYNLQLYDSPHFYPFYQGRDWRNAWDVHGRCSANCRKDGCTLVCR